MAKNKETINAAEYGVDSRYRSNEEYISEAALLMENRLKRIKNLSKEQIIQARLVQLKLKMEDYLSKESLKVELNFSAFLKHYTDTVYSKRTKFAEDLSVTPIRLSQIINGHREPNDEFMKKLMIHSEKVYKNVCPFEKEIWYQVFFHEKLSETISTQDAWRKKLSKQVRLSETIH